MSRSVAVFEELASSGWLLQLPYQWVKRISSDYTGRLKKIPLEWIEKFSLDEVFEELKCWVENFTECVNNAEGSERENFSAEAVEEAFRKYASAGTESYSVTYFFAFLAYHIYAVKTGTNKSKRERAFLCRRIGLYLLTLPGALTRQLDDSNFYEHCLNLEYMLSTLNLESVTGRVRRPSGFQPTVLLSPSDTWEEVCQLEEYVQHLQTCLCLPGCPASQQENAYRESMTTLMHLLALDRSVVRPAHLSSKLHKIATIAGDIVIGVFRIHNIRVRDEYRSILFLNIFHAIGNFIDPESNECRLLLYMGLNNRDMTAVMKRFSSTVQQIAVEGGGPVFKDLLVLVQQVSNFSIHKADTRNLSVRFALCLLKAVPTIILIAALKFFFEMCESETRTERYIGVKILAEIVKDLEIQELHFNKVGSGPQISASYDGIMETIASCLDDCSPVVRKEALDSLAECTFSGREEVSNFLSDLLTSPENASPKKLELLESILLKTVDPRAHVRRSGLCIVSAFLKYNGNHLTPRYIDVLSTACQDESVMVRKMILKDITDLLLLFPAHSSLHEVFVEHVLAMCNDPEKSVVQGVSVFVKTVVFDRLDKPDSCAWKLLEKVQEMRGEVSLGRVIQSMLSTENEEMLHDCVAKTVDIVVGYLDSPHNLEAWMLFSLLIEQLPCPVPSEVVTEYISLVNIVGTESPKVLIYVQRCLNSCLELLSEPDAQRVLAVIRERLRSFSMPRDGIQQAIIILWKLYSVEEFENWRTDGERLCEKELRDCEEEYCRGMDPDQTCLAERQLLTLATLLAYRKRDLRRSEKRIFEAIAFVSLKRDTDLPCESLQTVAIIGLGLMALQSKEIASDIVPQLNKVLSFEFHGPESLPIVALCTYQDLSVRWGSLADQMTPSVLLLLKSDKAYIRARCLAVFTHLLTRDHIKMTQQFFLTLLYSILDDDPGNESLSRFVLIEKQRLQVGGKNVNLFAKYFLPAIFFFNAVQHAEFHEENAEQHDSMFCLPGLENERKRKILYCFLMKHLTDGDRLQITSDIATNILNRGNNFAPGIIESNYQLFEDCFKILCSDLLRMELLKVSTF